MNKRDITLIAITAAALIVSLTYLINIHRRTKLPAHEAVSRGIIADSAKEVPSQGFPAPSFTLPDLEGKEVSLTDYRGQVVLLNIWATWCPPCKEEMPSMEKLYQQLNGKGFQILAVSIDKEDTKVVKDFVQKNGLSFTILHDRKNILWNKYGMTGVPESFIIGKDGRIVEKVIGPRDWSEEDIVAKVEDILADRSPMTAGTVSSR